VHQQLLRYCFKTVCQSLSGAGANGIFRHCPLLPPPLPPPFRPAGDALTVCHGICTAEAEGRLAKDASDGVLYSGIHGQRPLVVGIGARQVVTQLHGFCKTPASLLPQ